MAIIISTIVAMFGWYIAHNSKNAHEIFKIRLKRRLESLENLLQALSQIADSLRDNNLENEWPDIKPAMATGVFQIQLYGNLEEIKMLKKYIRILENKEDQTNFIDTHAKLVDLLLNNMREELDWNSSNPMLKLLRKRPLH